MIALAAIVVVVVVVLQRGGSAPTAHGPSLALSGSSAARLQAGKLAAVVPLSGRPVAIATGQGSIWVAQEGGTVSRIDPTTKTVQTIVVGGDPVAIAVGQGVAWVVDTTAGSLIPIDAQTNEAGARIELVPGISSVAVAEGEVWVAGKLPSPGIGGIVYRIDPSTRAVIGYVGLAAGNETVLTVAVGKGSVWVTSEGASVELGAGPEPVLVASLDAFPSSALGQAMLKVPTTAIKELDLIPYVHGATLPGAVIPAPVTVGEGSVWVALPATRTLYRVDPATDQLLGQVGIPSGSTGIAVGDGHVWISSSDGTVSEVDATKVRVVATIRVGGASQGIALGPDGAPWIAARKA